MDGFIAPKAPRKVNTHTAPLRTEFEAHIKQMNNYGWSLLQVLQLEGNDTYVLMFWERYV